MFDDVVVDLLSRRVAWTNVTGLVNVETAPNHVVRTEQDAQGLLGASLWNLVDGTRAFFPGELVLKTAIAGKIALQREDTLELDVVDPLTGTVTRSPGIVGKILSVADFGRDRLALTRRSGTGGKGQDTLAVETLDGSSGLREREQVIQISWDEVLGARARGHLDPFLVVDPKLGAQLAIVTGCAGCPGTPSRLHTRALSAFATTQSAPWREEPEPAPLARAPLSAEEKRLLTTIPTSESATFVDLSPGARRLLAKKDARICVWSLEKAAPESCAWQDYEQYAFLDAEHVWLARHDHDSFEIGVWDLASGQRATGHYEATRVEFTQHAGRFLTFRQAQDESWTVDVWTWPRKKPDFSHSGCSEWQLSGRYLTCPSASEGSALTVSLETGELLAAPPSKVPESAYTYDVDLALGNGVAQLSRAGNQATLYSFGTGTSDWAIVLPDGRYAGSDPVDRYLAFYDRSGTLLNAAQIAALRNPEAVRATLRAMRAGLQR
ncbi:MAG TPA: hypothetical protein VFK05_31215 [Polyangiaceae bacterium]|nr:hypothetical protein [Polyangiaceae bacterium]